MSRVTQPLNPGRRAGRVYLCHGVERSTNVEMADKQDQIEMGRRMTEVGVDEMWTLEASTLRHASPATCELI